MKKQNGFTLLELMIVVVIIAIIAAFAMFNYAKYGYRSRRVDGKEMLARVAASEERYYTIHNQYTNDLSQMGYAAAAPCNQLGASDKCYYQVTAAVSGTGNNSYLLTAAPQGAQSKDTCGSLTLDNANSKTPKPGVNASNGECW